MLLKNCGWQGLLLTSICLIASNFASATNAGLAVVGPIDQVNCGTGTFRILGIRFQASTKSVLSSLCSSEARPDIAYVVVGSKNSSGKAMALSVVEAGSEMYVPGASTVFIRGPVSQVSPKIGEFEVAGTRVVGLVGQLPALDSSIDVVGTQPLLGDAVVATSAAPTPSSKAAADANLTNAIIGSGASSSAIIGSGSSSSAIIGSGASTNAIIGSGSTKSAIIGSGASTSAIIGSGSSSNAIIGSGSSKNAIIGSGASTLAIIGSGLQ